MKRIVTMVGRVSRELTAVTVCVFDKDRRHVNEYEEGGRP